MKQFVASLKMGKQLSDAGISSRLADQQANTLGALVCPGCSILRVDSNPWVQVSIQESWQGGSRPIGSGVLRGARQSRLSSHRVRRGVPGIL